MGLLAGASSVSLRKPVKLRNHQGLTSQLHVSQISITALTWPFIVQQSLPSLICVIIMIIITPLGHTVFSHALWTHQCPGSVLNTGAWCFKGLLKHHCFCVLRWRPDFFSKFLEEHQLHFKSCPAMSPGKPSICEIWERWISLSLCHFS